MWVDHAKLISRTVNCALCPKTGRTASFITPRRQRVIVIAHAALGLMWHQVYLKEIWFLPICFGAPEGHGVQGCAGHWVWIWYMAGMNNPIFKYSGGHHHIWLKSQRHWMHEQRSAPVDGCLGVLVHMVLSRLVCKFNFSGTRNSLTREKHMDIVYRLHSESSISV